MIKNRVLLFIFFVGLVNSLTAQAPKYSNEFLAIGVGARAFGMSNTQVSFVNDVTAGYWNPAGLVGIQGKMQLGLMHSEYFAGIAKYDYGALAVKIDDKSCAALSIIRFGVDDIPNTTELIDAEGNIDYNRITTFSAADYGFLLSYARQSKIKGLNYGGNLKIVYRQIGKFAHAWGFGLDLGLQYQLKKWHFGAMARDITTTFNAWSYNLDDATKEVFQKTGNELPENNMETTLPRLNLGVAKEFDLGKKFTFLAAADFDFTFDKMRNVLIKSDPISVDPHVGIEFGYNNVVFLRGGVGNFQKETDLDGKRKTTFQPNIGVGIVIKKLVAIDYALTDVGNASIALYSNVFSVKVNINRLKKAIDKTDTN